MYYSAAIGYSEFRIINQSRGESLLNKNIVKMLRIIKKTDIAEKVGLYTNGILLDEKMSEGLIDARLDVLHINKKRPR